MDTGDLIDGDRTQIHQQGCHVVGYMKRRMATKRKQIWSPSYWRVALMELCDSRQVVSGDDAPYHCVNLDI